jgi:hypothetical protein
MIACYEELWPDHPFVFRIPYQNKALNLITQRREYIQTSSEIRATVLTLLEDLDDDEWIYWCIDDKYPVLLDLNKVKAVYQLTLEKGSSPHLSALLFCRARRLLDANYLFPDTLNLHGLDLIRRSSYHQIWIHQFVRAKVIRFLFSRFPADIPRAKDMDALKDILEVPTDHGLYVASTNYAVFGESTCAGILTNNCRDSLLIKRLPLPSWHSNTTSTNIIIGSL